MVGTATDPPAIRGLARSVAKNAWLALASGLLGLVVGLLGIVVGDLSEWTERQVEGLLVWVLFTCSGALVVLYLEVFRRAQREARNAYVDALRRHHTKNNLSVVDKQELTTYRAAMPTFVRFSERMDRLIVEANGDAVLCWDFRLEYRNDVRLSSIYLPIVVEKFGHGPVEASDLPFVEHIRTLVDGVPSYGAKYRTRESAGPSLRGTEPAFHVEYGLLDLPLPHDEGRASVHIEAEFKFEGVFADGTDGHVTFFVVDIPYITERMQLSVEPSGEGHEVHAVGSSRDIDAKLTSVEASSHILGIEDPAESHSQSGQLATTARGFRWTTSAAKVGYRYRVRFRILERGSSTSR